MTDDERLAYARVALANWEPDYPGEKTPTVKVWFTDEPEGGLSGFLLKTDRDDFSAGGNGPFLRVITGNTFRQMPYRLEKYND